MPRLGGPQATKLELAMFSDQNAPADNGEPRSDKRLRIKLASEQSKRAGHGTRTRRRQTSALGPPSEEEDV